MSVEVEKTRPSLASKVIRRVDLRDILALGTGLVAVAARSQGFGYSIVMADIGLCLTSDLLGLGLRVGWSTDRLAKWWKWSCLELGCYRDFQGWISVAS